MGQYSFTKAYETTLQEKKGSARHIDVLLNSPDKLRELDSEEDINFHIKEVLSPLKGEDYKECGNSKVLEKLGLSEHKEELINFWPQQGHHWDGVAIAKDGTALLIEAKAHISEMDSSPMDRSTPVSTRLRLASLKETAEYFGARFNADNWTGAKYQTANRLAFAYFLTEKLNKPARVVYIMFTGDKEMTDGKVETGKEWDNKFQEAFRILGLPTDDSENGRKAMGMLQKMMVPVKWLYK